MKHIVIIGGGFCGILTAVNLARFSHAPLQVSVINHGYPLGCGIAHGTRRPEHLLNVAARNMSAFPDYPNHFVDWLRTRVEYADIPEAELREPFIPRRTYGEYLRSLALHYTQPADQRSEIKVSCLEDEAVNIELFDERPRVLLASGKRMEADKVVIATGNEPPAVIPGAETLGGSHGYCANPWTGWEGRLPAQSEDIILLGTGLTMVDAVVTLFALHWRGGIHAVSRHGLLPMPHFKGIDYNDFPPAGQELAGLGLGALAQLIEEHCARLRARGANPGIVVDKMRPHTQRVWQQMSLSDKKEFCSRYAARWNVIRHRIAQPVHARVMEAVNDGRLKITRGKIVSLEAKGNRIAVNLSAPDGSASQLTGALVINCTGPDTRYSSTRSILHQNLMANGLAQPDEMDMGIRVDPSYALIDSDDRRSGCMFAIGPLLRGTLWESIAVPELRVQALKVAQTLVDECAPGYDGQNRWGAYEEPTVMEYWI